MARRFCVSEERETSAQTGRPMNLAGLGFFLPRVMKNPERTSVRHSNARGKRRGASARARMTTLGREQSGGHPLGRGMFWVGRQVLTAQGNTGSRKGCRSEVIGLGVAGETQCVRRARIADSRHRLGREKGGRKAPASEPSAVLRARGGD